MSSLSLWSSFNLFSFFVIRSCGLVVLFLFLDGGLSSSMKGFEVREGLIFTLYAKSQK